MSNKPNSYYSFYTESNKHILVGDEKPEMDTSNAGYIKMVGMAHS